MKSMKLSKKLDMRLRNIGTKNKRIKAGIAVAAGTYGCVFRPPLHCKDSSQTYDASKYVSKLMKKKDVYKEVDEVRRIKNRLLSSVSREYIDKYFILAKDEDTCKINLDSTSEKGKKNISDLKTGEMGGTHDCLGIYTSASYVKRNPEKYEILNMIDGGNDLSVYLDKETLTVNSFNKLNNSLIDLLENGIVKMNSLGIYHCDLKNLNMVYKDRVRIIDWGLASRLDVPFTKENFPMNEQAIQIYHQMYYGIPFTNTFLYNKFEHITKKYDTKEKYKAYLKETYNEETISYLSTLNSYNKRVNNSGKSLIDIIIDNQAAVVYSGVAKEDFFNFVFFKNADIFGFLQIYINISNNLRHSKDATLKIVDNNIKLLINKYILSDNYAIKPYLVREIVTDLKNLTKKSGSLKKKQKLDKELDYLDEFFDKSSEKKAKYGTIEAYLSSKKEKSGTKKVKSGTKKAKSGTKKVKSGKKKAKSGKKKAKSGTKKAKSAGKVVNCKGLSQEECNKLKECMYTKGSKRQFCRTKKNKKKN